MNAKKNRRTKKFFTPTEANAALPLVQAIVRDISELAGELHERYERLSRDEDGQGTLSEMYQEENRQAEEEIERGQDRLRDYVQELTNLGVLLKDPHAGLIDFPCWMGNREVYLCWKLGEPEVAHWHEVDAGFSGRKRLMADARK